MKPVAAVRCKRLAITGMATGMVLIGGLTPGVASAQQSVTLNMATLGTVAGLSSAIATYEATHRNITIRVTSTPSNTYQEVVPAELSANRGPDIMGTFPGAAEAMAIDTLVKNGNNLYPLNKSLAATMPESDVTLNSYHGKLYAVTPANAVAAIAYNKTDFQTIHVSPPVTFSQLLADCKSFRAKGDYFMALGNGDLYMNTNTPTLLQDAVIYASNPQYLSQSLGKPSSYWTGPNALYRKANLIAYEDYASMVKNGCIYPGSLGMSVSQAAALVITGQAASTNLIGNWPELVAADGHNTFGTFNLPALDKIAPIPLTVDPTALWAVNAKSHHLEQAVAFLKYLVSPAVVGKMITANDWLPVKSIANFKPAPIFANVYPDVQSGKTLLFPVNYEPNYKVKLTQETWGEKIIDGTATAAQAAAATLAPFNS